MGAKVLAGTAARAKGFYLQEGKFRIYKDIFYREGGSALAQVTHRDGRGPIPRNIQGQTGGCNLI